MQASDDDTPEERSAAHRAKARLSRLSDLMRRSAMRIYYIGRTLRERGFDWRHGADTADHVDARDLGYRSDQGFEHYQPITLHWFQRMARELPREFRQSAFVDLGSGKGRALMFASRYRFTSITGVEYSQRLHDVACANLERFAPDDLARGRVELVNGDAGVFAFPDTARLVVFMYNPFQRAVMDRVVANLRTWLERGRREVVILYRNPVHAAAFHQAPFRCIAATVGYRCWHAASEGVHPGRTPLPSL